SLILRCSDSKSLPFSTPFASRSRGADERSWRLFHALARSPGLSVGRCCSVVFPPDAAKHFAGRLGGCAGPLATRIRCRLLAQAGGSHRDWSLRLYAQSALSR